MKIFLFVVKYAPWLTALAMVTALVSGLFSGGLITLIHRALDFENQGSGTLWLWFLLLVVLTLVSAIAANVVISHLYRTLLLELQIRLARAIIHAPLRKLEEIGGAALLATLTEDVDDISDMATELVPLMTNLVTSLVCFGYLIWLSWQAFLGTLIFLLVGGLSYQLLISREQHILTLGRESIDSLYEYFQDLTEGIKELKLNQKRAHAFLAQVLTPTARLVQKHLFRWDLAYVAISTWGRFLILVVVGLIIFLLPKYLSLRPEVFTGYVLTMLYVRSSLLSIIDTLPELSEAAVALRKVEAVGLTLSNSAVDPDDDVTPPRSWHSLKLVNVVHRYYREREDDFFRLGPITLEFQPGELVFLVGGNGSGKTTLAKLITGLYPPEAGEIYLDGEQICDRVRSQYSQLFSVVFTDFHLFDTLLGIDHQPLEPQVKQYLAKLHLDHKLTIQNGKFSTTALSRGQQQRLALLIAYLEDRPFYIFDEWAANQDPIFKEIFYTELLPKLKAKGKTILVISHDDNYFYIADRVLKLTDGKLQGSPQKVST